VRTLNPAFAEKINYVHYVMYCGFDFFQLCSVQVEIIFPLSINLLEALNEPFSFSRQNLWPKIWSMAGYIQKFHPYFHSTQSRT